jgi:hypothetical protein
MRAIQNRLAVERNLLPPLDVVRAVAVLIGQDILSEVICNSQSDEDSTTWRVVGLLESGCLFTAEVVGNEQDWDSGSFRDAEGRVEAELSAHIRSLSDVASLMLTQVTGYEHGRPPRFDPVPENRLWNVDAAWGICWRDGSPTLTLPMRADATKGERATGEAIVNKVRQVLAER